MSLFIECESYKHKYAKIVVKKWLDNTECKYGWQRYKTTDNNSLDFCTNRDSGVWLEYPVTKLKIYNYKTNTIEQLWDETIDYRKMYSNYDLDLKEAIDKCGLDVEITKFKEKYACVKNMNDDEYVQFIKNKEFSKNYFDIERYIDNKYNTKPFTRPPTYNESLEYGETISILDIAIATKGSIRYGVEICHKNPASEEKIKNLCKNGLENLIELDAEWVISQVKQPDKIKVKRWLIKNGEIVI